MKSRGKIWFVGAGPGAADLITLRGARLLAKAGAVLYTGSLVPEELTSHCSAECIIESSAKMDYDQIFQFLLGAVDQHQTVVRLHTGDPVLYSTIARQIELLRRHSIDFEVVPGVSSGFAAAAAAAVELTIPGVSQSVLFTRMPGRTPNPESLEKIFALHHTSLIFYLSASLAAELQRAALEQGHTPSTPCMIVEKATWPEERILRCQLDQLATTIENADIRGTAVIYLGEFLHQQESEPSHLYSRPYRKEASS